MNQMEVKFPDGGVCIEMYCYANILHPAYRGREIHLHRKEITQEFVEKHQNLVQVEDMEVSGNILDDTIFLEPKQCDTPEKYDRYMRQQEAVNPVQAPASLSLFEQSNFEKEVAR